jgi:hypothetical protein
MLTSGLETRARYAHFWNGWMKISDVGRVALRELMAKAWQRVGELAFFLGGM